MYMLADSPCLFHLTFPVDYYCLLGPARAEFRKGCDRVDMSHIICDLGIVIISLCAHSTALHREDGLHVTVHMMNYMCRKKPTSENTDFRKLPRQPQSFFFSVTANRWVGIILIYLSYCLRKSITD